MTKKHSDDKTYFGFKEVATDEKAKFVEEVFSNVADKYDIMNDFMSLGIHRLWKERMINELNPRPNSSLLDVAGGTGDIALRFLQHTKNSRVTICDINQAMLQAGKRRLVDKNILQSADFLCADAEKLPLPDASFDYYTIAFGIRNVTHITKALSEALRVLKPGGRFLCLEFSHVDNQILGKIYDIFSFKLIPQIGKIIAKDADSYRYLVESIRKFPKQEAFATMIKQAGFNNVTYRDLSGGIVALHSGWKV